MIRLTVTQDVIAHSLSCIGLRGPVDTGLSTLAMSLLCQVLSTEKSDSEAAYRALVALGNFVRYFISLPYVHLMLRF